MTMKHCTKCAEKIQWAALTCRFCGSDQPAPLGDPPMSRWKVGCLWVGAIIGILIFVGLSAPKDPALVALQKCDERTYFEDGSSIEKLGPEERWQCAQDAANTPE